MSYFLDWHFSSRFSDTIIAESDVSSQTYMIQEDEEAECFKVSVFKYSKLDPWYTASFETLVDAVRDCEHTEAICRPKEDAADDE